MLNTADEHGVQFLRGHSLGLRTLNLFPLENSARVAYLGPTVRLVQWPNLLSPPATLGNGPVPVGE